MPAGTEGAVSLEGTLAGVVGSVIISGFAAAAGVVTAKVHLLAVTTIWLIYQSRLNPSRGRQINNGGGSVRDESGVSVSMIDDGRMVHVASERS